MGGAEGEHVLVDVSATRCQWGLYGVVYGSEAGITAGLRQTAVAAYFSSNQLLLFVFVRRSVCQYSMAEEKPAAQKQSAVTAYLESKQLLLFVFVP